jgi:hypothetical protein
MREYAVFNRCPDNLGTRRVAFSFATAAGFRERALPNRSGDFWTVSGFADRKRLRVLVDKPNSLDVVDISVEAI